jgi:Flp pilus assembly protein TadD
MRRLALRIVGLALCTTALTGCGMLGGSGGGDADLNPVVHNGGDSTAPMTVDIGTGVRQAQLLRTSGDLNGAMRILSQLMLGAPDDPRVVGEYGKLLVQQGRSADAVQFLHRAVELQPNDWTLYSALGVAYDKQTDAPNAKLAYERALVLKPGEPAVLNNFAMSRMLAGDPVAARTLMMQAQAGGSTDPRIAQNLALLDARTPAAAPVTAIAAAQPVAPPAQAVATAAPRAPVMANALPPAAMPAHNAPRPLTQGGAQVVMQDVPVDPLAGPVGRAAHPAKPVPLKPSKLAKTGKPAKVAAAARPDKAAKPAPHVLADAKPPKKPDAHDHIPSLRMTADASKP